MAIRLFQPIDLRDLTLQNRIVVPSMTQFSCDDGVAGDWRPMHLGQFGASGAARVNTESTYVEARARNAPTCMSLYTEEQADAIGRITAFFRSASFRRRILSITAFMIVFLFLSVFKTLTQPVFL